MLELIGENNALIEATLRRAEYGRTNNFDIVQKEGYVFLREEITADFPYLTLADLRAIITAGVKGEIDATKTPRPLNCTRIYQWVRARVVFTAGYWKTKYPALMEWPTLLGILPALLAELDTYETPAAAFAQPHKFRGLLQKVVRAQFYPQLGDDYRPLAHAETYPDQAVQYRRLESEFYPEFLRRHPELQTQHQAIF